tara:strand:- start:80 stop:307 length:228 start_codon:yes stop_codon:yes gene_type:complete
LHNNVLKNESELKIGTVKAKITSDFIIDLYEQSKDLEGEDKENFLVTIKILTEHIGEFLVKDDLIEELNELKTEE